MKVALIRTAIVPDKERHLAYGSNIFPMATPVALLGACLLEKFPEIKVSILNENWPTEKIAKRAAPFDLVGISTTYATLGSSCEISRRIKQLNPEVKIIFGGIDAANKGPLILKNHPDINYVCGDPDHPWGEDTITGLANRTPAEQIPNLWYRRGREILFTFHSISNLRKTSMWDFRQCEEHDERIRPYLKTAGDWDLPHHSVFSWRGCLKALRRGRCAFCTSAVGQPNFISPENFWKQIIHLQENEFSGIKMNLYLGDNHVPPSWAKKLAEKMPVGINARFRAYGWLPEIISLNPAQLKDFAQDLHIMGFYNLFYGVESFDHKVLSLTNKDFVPVSEMARVITELFHKGGVRATIAIIIGLPGENEESLKTTLVSFWELIACVPSGAIERVYLSHLVVLHGSAVMDDMKKNSALCTDYERLTGKVLADDDDPPVDLLTALHLKYFTEISPAIANIYHDRIVETALETGIPRQQIGGFEERHIIDNIFNRL